MEQLRIADHDEWWITWENGYGDHSVVAKVRDQAIARAFLKQRRAVANCECKERYEAQKVTIHHTAEKLDW